VAVAQAVEYACRLKDMEFVLLHFYLTLKVLSLESCDPWFRESLKAGNPGSHLELTKSGTKELS
jgi:hypothetical protein